ncbi:LLM class flavin-dependent oxidoreductase [Burkholderia stagnalis]
MTQADARVRITRISFLTPGNYAADDPLPGLEQTLDLFRIGEALGYDCAWVRQRHLERAVSSAATFLAAASQHTTRIGLGAAVIQMGYENPFRLAEDLATVDILSRGRLNVGLSAGAPPHGALLGDRLFDGMPEQIDFSHARVARLRANLTGDLLGDEQSFVESPAGRERPRVMPYARGLTQRLWYGGGSLRSAEWAGRNGFNLLIGNLNSGERTDDFFDAQRSHVDAFRSNWQGVGAPRIALGRVIVPTDSADQASRRRYRAFAAERVARTRGPQGPRRTLYAEDLVGSAAEIAERLLEDPIVRQVRELRLELPYDLAPDEYEQILTDFVLHVAPHLGWQTGAAVAA